MSPKKADVDVTTSAGSAKLSTKALQGLKDALADNRLIIKDTEASQKYPEVIDFASKFIKHKRHSEMDEMSQRAAVVERDYNAFRNEATFVHEMWQFMHKDRRDKRISGDPDSDIVSEDWTTEMWSIAHLGASWDLDFKPDSIPHLENTDIMIIKLLDVSPRIKNPKPDLAYGIKFSAFTRTELDVIRLYQQYSQISPGISFPFFAAEFKGGNGTMGEAILQACRSGAAMVNAIRELYKVAGLEKKDAGADTQSFVFTMALDTTNVNMYVNWAEVIPGKPTIYHMHLIGAYHLEIASAFQSLRHDLNNILDWGLSERLKQLKTTLNTIYKKELSSSPPPPAKKQKTGRGEGEEEHSEMEKVPSG